VKINKAVALQYFNTKPYITTEPLYCSKNIAVSTLIILWYYSCKTIVQLNNSERLKCLKLPTLTYRRYRGDMIEVYKIISGKYDNNIAINLDVNKDSRTRGNLFKLKNKCFHYDIRNFRLSSE